MTLKEQVGKDGGVFNREQEELLRRMLSNYPETYEWVKHLADSEGVPFHIAFYNYYDYITTQMIPREKENAENDWRDCWYDVINAKDGE